MVHHVQILESREREKKALNGNRTTSSISTIGVLRQDSHLSRLSHCSFPSLVPWQQQRHHEPRFDSSVAKALISPRLSRVPVDLEEFSFCLAFQSICRHNPTDLASGIADPSYSLLLRVDVWSGLLLLEYAQVSDLESVPFVGRV